MSIPKVKFSYGFTRGSCTERKLKRQALNQKFFSGIMDLYENTDSVSMRIIEKKYKKMMPESIHFSIKKLLPSEAESILGTMQTEFVHSKLVKYRVKVESGSKLEIKRLPILIHEITHLLDMLFNPKTICTEEAVEKRNLSEIFKDLYTNNYCQQYESLEELKKHISIIKKRTKKALKNLSAEDKVLVLNNIKNNLITEINALREEEKYARELKLMGRDVEEDSLETKSETDILERKLKLVEQIIYRIITDRRHQLAMKHISNPLTKLKISLVHEFKALFSA